MNKKYKYLNTFYLAVVIITVLLSFNFGFAAEVVTTINATSETLNLTVLQARVDTLQDLNKQILNSVY